MDKPEIKIAEYLKSDNRGQNRVCEITKSDKEKADTTKEKQAVYYGNQYEKRTFPMLEKSVQQKKVYMPLYCFNLAYSGLFILEGNLYLLDKKIRYKAFYCHL